MESSAGWAGPVYFGPLVLMLSIGGAIGLGVLGDVASGGSGRWSVAPGAGALALVGSWWADILGAWWRFLAVVALRMRGGAWEVSEFWRVVRRDAG